MKNASTQSGFTIVELLVAIAVTLMFLGGMLFGRDDFDSTVRLGSIAREVALIAREAQTYGAGGGSSDASIGKPHGIHLNSSDPSKITLYTDENDPADGYDSGEGIEEFQLPGPYSIDSFCVSDDAGDKNCSSLSSLNELDIYFVRPSLSANYRDGSGSLSKQKAIIDLIHDESGKMRSVIVDTTGYITVP